MDLVNGVAVKAPDKNLLDLVDALARTDAEICIGDVDRSMGRPPQLKTIHSLLQSHPDRLFVGGGLDPESAIDMLTAGAQGVVLGVGTVARYGDSIGSAARSVSLAMPAGSLCISVDFKGDSLAHRTYGVDKATRWEEAAEAILVNSPVSTQLLVVNLAAKGQDTDWLGVASVKERSGRGQRVIYSGGIRSWSQVHAAWAARLDVAVGGAYFKERRLGLPVEHDQPGDGSGIDG